MLPRLVGLTLLALLLVPATSQGAAKVERVKYRYGPITIKPGQNTISLDGDRIPKPKVSGWIVGFRPNLERANGKIPGVDVLHLHHAVWIINNELTFAAGEEKTNVKLPRPFGWRHRPQDRWVLNHMVHNLLPNRDRVYLTYTLDFIPDSSRAAKGMRPVQTSWLDVEGSSDAYPVFDVHRGSGSGGRFTYPDDVPGVYGNGPARNQMQVEEDGVLVQTAGHLHPGGLWTDLELTRGGRTVNLFRSRAKYWEPAGAVSWDVAMTATRRNWRVRVRRGDVLSVSATYDSKRGSWYESMGIMPVAFAAGRGGVDPFSGRLERRGRLTHGHLPENDNHGGRAGGLPDPRRMSAVPASADPLAITDFSYGQGDLLGAGAASRPPEVAAGQSLQFVNRDAARTIFHTITACRAPCNRTTGIAYPLADGPVEFDSGQLGFGPEGFTAAANRDTWSTPPTLGSGTYTYFCRVHPFMRGAFRVKG